MPSTYTNNLGIILPADGEEDGTWGDLVNDNMAIIDRAINGSLQLALTGTSSTLVTGEGSTTGVNTYGQYKAIILGGTPSGTHTITIVPNDAQKIYFVYNLSGQSVVFYQGSGTTVTIANGDSGIIYSNGAGATAGVVNLTDNFAMNSVKITGGTITGITDLAIADGGTGASTAANALLNFGLTATAAEINVLDGITASTAELNILDGVTASTAELNILDGLTATTTELNYVDGVTSAIQTQINTKAPSTTPTLAGTITLTGGAQSWTVTPSGVNLTFAYNGVNRMRLDSSGNLTVTGNVTGYGTIS